MQLEAVKAASYKLINTVFPRRIFIRTSGMGGEKSGVQ